VCLEESWWKLDQWVSELSCDASEPIFREPEDKYAGIPKWHQTEDFSYTDTLDLSMPPTFEDHEVEKYSASTQEWLMSIGENKQAATNGKFGSKGQAHEGAGKNVAVPVPE